MELKFKSECCETILKRFPLFQFQREYQFDVKYALLLLYNYQH